MKSAGSIAWTGHVAYLQVDKYAQRRLFLKGMKGNGVGGVISNSLFRDRNEPRVPFKMSVTLQVL